MVRGANRVTSRNNGDEPVGLDKSLERNQSQAKRKSNDADPDLEFAAKTSNLEMKFQKIVRDYESPEIV